MPEYCTCGTKLVEDARFCHRCGRPTAEPSIEEAAPSPPPPAQPTLQERLQQLPVNFSNPVALRVALLISVATIPIELTPILSMFFVLWWLAAGWCAVLFYRRLTGSVLSVRAGARLGSITGVLTFLGYVIAITIVIVFTGKQFFDEMANQGPDVSKVVNDPPMLFAFLIVLLVFLCAFVVAICAAGGALGARYVRRRANRA